MLSDDLCDKLGDYSKIVEIDESVFEKMKYGRRRSVNGKWVFEHVERGLKKCFFKVIEDRKKEILLSISKDWVLPDSTKISDYWAV